jgi:hypothetical protein
MLITSSHAVFGLCKYDNKNKNVRQLTECSKKSLRIGIFTRFAGCWPFSWLKSQNHPSAVCKTVKPVKYKVKRL